VSPARFDLTLLAQLTPWRILSPDFDRLVSGGSQPATESPSHQQHVIDYFRESVISTLSCISQFSFVCQFLLSSPVFFYDRLASPRKPSSSSMLPDALVARRGKHEHADGLEANTDVRRVSTA
jgi:hypothetical protein